VVRTLLRPVSLLAPLYAVSQALAAPADVKWASIAGQPHQTVGPLGTLIRRRRRFAPSNVPYTSGHTSISLRNLKHLCLGFRGVEDIGN
jgi:hypothetical protein